MAGIFRELSMLFAAGIALATVLLSLLIYRYDLYEREPWYLVVAAILMGAAGMWIAGEVEGRIILQYELFRLRDLAMLASVVEEIAKLSVVILIAVFVHKHFNDPMDGLVYGAFAGLGASLTESWVLLGETEFSVAVMAREFVRMVLHLLMGGLIGFAVGVAKFRRPYWWAMILVWPAASFTFHFGWDYYCGLRPLEDNPFQQRLIAVILMLSGLIAFGISVSLASHWSRMHLAPWSRLRVWHWHWPWHPEPTRTSSLPSETTDEESSRGA